MLTGEHRLFLAGDALMTQPWSHIEEPLFIQLVAAMRAADITILNLETLVHEYRGYAQAHSGGSYMASPPPIASELKWAGVDMVSHANNHAFDYGPEGVIETHEHVGAAGIVIAGTGKDLQSARAPQYFVRNGTKIGLVSMASTFVAYGAASSARPDMRGRPGVNPLNVSKSPLCTITRKQADMLAGIVKRLGRHPDKYLRRAFRVWGMDFQVGQGNRLALGSKIRQSDVFGNLASIEQAAASADLTVVAIHAHQQGRWLRKFCHMAVARGADVIFVHGPHDVRGIEIHRGRPIFYGLGDFVYQTDQIERLPAEAYERAGLEATATIQEYHGDGMRHGLQRTRSVYESIAAMLHYTAGKLSRISLLPLDLQFDAAYRTRGRPQLAKPDLGNEIIARVAKRSSRFGTGISYDPQINQGTVALD